MGYAVELLNGGSLHCGFWHYPITKRREERVPDGDMPDGSPLNGKRKPPLVFATEREAAVAVDFYGQLYGDSHIEAATKEVGAEPTHRLTDDGFEPVGMSDGLFA
jgi:hypothetical protein